MAVKWGGWSCAGENAERGLAGRVAGQVGWAEVMQNPHGMRHEHG